MAQVATLTSPEPPFDLQIGSVSSYEDLFSATIRGIWSETALIREALQLGRILIAGRGGGAKTVLLGKLAKKSVSLGHVPVFLSLKSWTQAHSEDWKQFDTTLARMNFLFHSLFSEELGVAELDSLDATIPRMIFLDGLNEVDGRIAQELVFSLDEYASAAINTSVIVSDRLVRRDFIRSDHWSLCLALPLSEGEIRKQLSASSLSNAAKNLTEVEVELLRSPYFLDAYLKSGRLAETRAQEIKTWFMRHVGLTAEDLVQASEAAYAVYGGSSRTFSIEQFQAIAGTVVTQKLIESGSGALIVKGSSAMFDHHLKHDFLASNHLASHENLWTSDSFDHVTFAASSFDAIMMCVEQVNELYADRFIRAVYDWNLYGVGYSIGESRKHHISPEMLIVILSMFAERRWDPILSTKRHAEDTLRLLKGREAAQFLTVSSLEEVFRLLRDFRSSEGSEWFREWQTVFIHPNSPVPDAFIDLVREPDSVLGWTSANVLKRSQLSEGQEHHLREFLEAQDPVIRWRAAHALGSFPSKINAEALSGRLGDLDKKVRYGAVRSLMELASEATDELRDNVFGLLIAHQGHLMEFTSVRDQISRCVLIPGARNPGSWLQFCLNLMITLQPSEAEGRRDKWNRSAQELINMFASGGTPTNA